MHKIYTVMHVSNIPRSSGSKKKTEMHATTIISDVLDPVGLTSLCGTYYHPTCGPRHCLKLYLMYYSVFVPTVIVCRPALLPCSKINHNLPSSLSNKYGPMEIVISK
jgi:hypothetical protein